MGISDKILSLKDEQDAVILAHNYQIPGIQDLADFVGDSLELARKATTVENSVIVFCGVDFMAETAKILNPEKKVLIPTPDACCPMAAMLDIDYLKEVKEENPEAKTVLYVNTRADAKALADCMCTSANADGMVNAMDSKTVIFGPDQNLSYYVSKRTNKELILVPPNGMCITHHKMGLDDLMSAKEEHPEAKVVVHPECIPEVQELADAVGSTSGILRFCKETPAKEVIIGTEEGMIHRLKKEIPNKEFYPLSSDAVCVNMKKNNLQNLHSTLRDLLNEVTVPESIMEKSRKSIECMLDLSKK